MNIRPTGALSGSSAPPKPVSLHSLMEPICRMRLCVCVCLCVLYVCVSALVCVYVEQLTVKAKGVLNYMYVCGDMRTYEWYQDVCE